MTQTRPRGEQLRFESAKTGSHILDDYLEAVERGGRTLPDLIDDLFDSSTGAFRSDLFQFREDPDNPGFIQFRVGDYVDPNTGWITLSYTDFADLVASTTDAKDDAEAAAALAQRWASDPEDSVVSGGLYSSRHYSLKSASSASSSASARDASITARDESIAARNASQDARDASIGARDAAITAKDAALLAQNAAENARDTAISVTSSMTGGTTGQVLIKNSATDYDYAWAAPFANGDMHKSVYDPNNHETDAFARTNHTGEQPISSITGLQSALNAKQASSEKGAANGYAGLDSSGKVPTSQLPAAVLGSVSYQGPWNAATNTPTIPAASSANKGHYYVVTTAGSTTVDGENDWKVKDWIISDGASWSKVDNTESVISVAGKTGAITLSIGDIANLQDALNNKQASLNNQVSIELGSAVSSSQPTYIDFHTLDGPSDHSARIIRNVGADGSFGISNTGTGPIDLSASGGVTINGGTAWHSGNFTPSNYVGLTGTQQINGHKRFTSNLTSIGQATGAGAFIEAFSTSANAAGIAFHRSGAFAGYFGVDTDNKLKWGGWSMGANAYEIYHEGNFNPANYLPLAGGTMAPGAVIQFANETAVKLFFYNNGASRYGAAVEGFATVLFGGTTFRFRGGNEVGTVYGELTSAGFKLAASAATPTDPLHAAPKQYVEQYVNLRGAKAWVNFNGTGTVAIRSAHNVSSISDLGTGNYRVNFATAMPSADYCAVANSTYNTSGNTIQYQAGLNNYQTTSIDVWTAQAGTTNNSAQDNPIVNVVVFGG